MIDAAGYVVTDGSESLVNASAAIHDDPIVARFRAAGAIITGMTIMTEGGVTPKGYAGGGGGGGGGDIRGLSLSLSLSFFFPLAHVRCVLEGRSSAQRLSPPPPLSLSSPLHSHVYVCVWLTPRALTLSLSPFLPFRLARDRSHA